MQTNVAIFRNHNGLNVAVNEIQKIKQQFLNMKIIDFSLEWNLELQEYLELENLIICAEATSSAALWRKESRGSHWRHDYPKRDDKNFLVHSIYLSNEKAQCIKKPLRNSATIVGFSQPTDRIY